MEFPFTKKRRKIILGGILSIIHHTKSHVSYISIMCLKIILGGILSIIHHTKSHVSYISIMCFVDCI